MRVRVGVVGCGAIAQMMHLPNLLAEPDRFDVVGVADVNAPLAQAVAQRHGVPRWWDDPLKLIPEVDAVLVATSGSHTELVEACLERGKEVFVEKPVAYRVSEAEQLASLDGGTLTVGYMKRFDPAVERAKALIAELQGPFHVEVRVLHPDEALYMAHYDLLRIPGSGGADRRAEWRRAAREEIGSVSDAVADCYTDVLLGSVVHDVNLVRHLVGEIISADHTWIAEDGLKVQADVRFAEGSSGHFGWFYLPKLRHYVEEILILADDARLRLVFPSPYLKHFPTELHVERQVGASVITQAYGEGFAEAFVRELQHWHEVITGGGRVTPRTPLVDALQDLRALRAMGRALAAPVAVS